MAADRTTLTLADGMRLSINRHVDDTARRIILAWADAWNEIAGEWDAALEDLADMSRAGQWPTRAQVLRAERAKAALAVTRDALDQLATQLPVTVQPALPLLTAEAVDWEARLTASQYPLVAGTTSTIRGSFSQVSADAIHAIVDRTTRRITALSRPLSRDAERALRSVLIRGVAVGENPRTAASRMLRRVDQAFAGGRNRALVIARTEMLDAHRAGAAAHDAANKDILAGWQWLCALDKRTCPACWSMHGRTFPVDVPGPMDHQQGRCSRMPVTRPWSELGFPGIDEPQSVVPDARAVFDRLPHDDRAAIMGSRRLELLDSGDASWDDLAQRRTTAGWRDSYAPTPLRDLIPA